MFLQKNAEKKSRKRLKLVGCERNGHKLPCKIVAEWYPKRRKMPSGVDKMKILIFFSSKIFGHVKKKQYLCRRFRDTASLREV